MKALENTVGKGENAGNQAAFSHFSTVFFTLPKKENTIAAIFICRLQMLSIWSSQKFCLMVKG